MNQGSPLLSGSLIHVGRPGGQVEAQPSLGVGSGSRSYAFHCHDELTLRAGNMPLCLGSPWTF